MPSIFLNEIERPEEYRTLLLIFHQITIIMRKNMGSLDRGMRLTIAAILLVLFFANILSGTIGTIALIVAIIFALTSIVNFCPLYAPFGWSTRKSSEK